MPDQERASDVSRGVKGVRALSSPAAQRTLLVSAYVVCALAGSTLVIGSALLAHTPPEEGWVTVVGDALALLILSLVSLQFLLSSRFHWMERPWGLDRLLWLHRRMGPVIGLLVLTHPLVLASALQALSDAEGTELHAHFTHWGVWLGVLGATAVAVLLVTTYFVEEIGLTYERWRAIHNLALVVVLAGFLHAWAIGPHVAPVSLVAVVVTAWALVAVGTIVHTTFIKPRLLPRYRVADVTQETHDTWTVRMAPPEGEVFDFLPGQFIFLTLYRQGFPPEEHPFTISSPPTGRDSVTVTAKAIGDFTATIKDTRPGDLAAIDGPYGRFTYVGVREQALLLISGGVGITPFASCLRHIRDTNGPTDVVLIDANKTEADIIFRRELDELAGCNPNTRIVHVLSEPGGDWAGERGFVDENLLRRQVADITSRLVFLCGPPPMMSAARRTLADLGVPGSRIRTEEFRLK